MKVKKLKFSWQLGLLAEDNFRHQSQLQIALGTRKVLKTFTRKPPGRVWKLRVRVSMALCKSNQPGCSGVRVLINLLKKSVLHFNKKHQPLNPCYFY